MHDILYEVNPPNNIPIKEGTRKWAVPWLDKVLKAGFWQDGAAKVHTSTCWIQTYLSHLIIWLLCMTFKATRLTISVLHLSSLKVQLSDLNWVTVLSRNLFCDFKIDILYVPPDSFSCCPSCSFGWQEARMKLYAVPLQQKGISSPSVPCCLLALRYCT